MKNYDMNNLKRNLNISSNNNKINTKKQNERKNGSK